MLAQELRVGDFIGVTGLRFGAASTASAEGCTRIDRIEHLSPGGDVVVTRGRAPASQPVVAVFAHGLPGVVLLRPGDHKVWRTVPESWRAHGERHTWWPIPATGTAFASAHTPPTGPEPDCAPAGQSTPRSLAPAGRHAAVFAKPAGNLAVGDYLRVLGCAEAQDHWDMDEGYAYVSWVAHVDPAVAERVFADPVWRSGPVTGVAVHGVPGLLLIPDRDVEVLVQPNRERVAFDRDESSLDLAPAVMLAGMSAADPVEQRARDAAARPEALPDEQDLYGSEFEDPERRSLHVDGVNGFRVVPMSQLPWPNQLFKCELLARAKAVRATYPTDEVAHGPVWPAVNAETFVSLADTDFAVCPYHRTDWASIAAACRDAVSARADATSDTPDICEALRADPRLSDGQRSWAEAVFTDPIIWDDGGTWFVNGQHRSCALRAAGVDAIPVLGRHLADREYPAAVDARADARARVEGFWRSQAETRYGDRRWARALAGRAAEGTRWARRVLGLHSSKRKGG